MPKILAVASQKGGVGKSSISINLASVLAEKEPVLLIDWDPQGNSTLGMGYEEADLEKTIVDVIEEGVDVQEAIIRTNHNNLSLLPSDIGLASFELTESRPDRLAQIVRPVLDDYEWIIIDCPPSLGRLTVTALTLAERVLIPVYPGRFSLRGLNELLNTVESIRLRSNPRIRPLGIVFNQVQVRTVIYQSVQEQIAKDYPQLVMDTVIPQNVKINEAQVVGEPVCVYDPASSGCAAFLNLAEEVRARWSKVARSV